MKIFFACHRFPFPPNRGGKIRPFNMIRHLSQKHEVVVASIAHTQRELDEGAGLKEYCSEIYAEVLPEKLRWLQAVRALPTPTPSSVAYFSSTRLHQRIKEAARKTSFDAVMVHCAFAAQYGLEVPARFCLMDFGDLDSGKWLDYSRERSFPLNLGYGFEARKLRAYERKVAGIFNYCTLTTEGELDEFNSLMTATPCSVIPNGVDTDYFQASEPNPSHKPVIIFLGRMDYFPNIDGILYFVKDVFPIIQQKLPKAELRIIGSSPVAVVQKLNERNGVTVTGFVQDVRPYLTDAAVSIAPLRLARGTQNKILESIAMGLPVVATSNAAKGVQAVPGEHLLVADSPDDFAGKVLDVLQQPNLGRSLAVAARRQIAQSHCWSGSMTLLDGILSGC